MNDSEMRRFIQEEIKRQVQVILAGISGDNTEAVEDIQNLYPGMPTLTQRPISHPFGFVSRAMPGTVQVVARHGEHIGNWVVLSHRDKNRPKVRPGEVVLYNTEFKTELRVYNNGFEIMANGVNLIEEMIKLLNTIINARTNTIFGPQPLIPQATGIPNGEEWTIIKQQLIKMKGEA